MLSRCCQSFVLNEGRSFRETLIFGWRSQKWGRILRRASECLHKSILSKNGVHIQRLLNIFLFPFWKYANGSRARSGESWPMGWRECAASGVFGKGGPWGTRGQGPLQPNSGQCCQDWWVSELWTGPEGVSHSAGKGMFPIKHFWLPGFFWLSLALASSLFPLNVFSGESFRCHVHGLLCPPPTPSAVPPLLLFHVSGLCFPQK